MSMTRDSDSRESVGEREVQGKAPVVGDGRVKGAAHGVENETDRSDGAELDDGARSA
jgi:hypothetical protein